MIPRTFSNLKEGFTMKRITAFLLATSSFLLSATAFCWAANYDFKQMTPEIQQALKERQSRYHQLQSLKQAGVVGENNKGYVTNLKESDAAAGALASAENRDRRVIYEALAEQNQLGNTGLLEVQRAFAEVQADKATAGEMLQSSSGGWKAKK